MYCTFLVTYMYNKLRWENTCFYATVIRLCLEVKQFHYLHVGTYFQVHSEPTFVQSIQGVEIFRKKIFFFSKKKSFILRDGKYQNSMNKDHWGRSVFLWVDRVYKTVCIHRQTSLKRGGGRINLVHKLPSTDKANGY